MKVAARATRAPGALRPCFGSASSGRPRPRRSGPSWQQSRALEGSKGSDRPFDCSRSLRPRLRRGCTHDDRTGASACDETRDLAVAGSRRAIAVDHARASARAKREAVRARDQTDVRRAVVTQMFDPEGRPVSKRLRSLAGSQVEIATDAVPVAE